MERPNGLAFSPDEHRLYVVDTPGGPKTVHVYESSTTAPGAVNGRVFFDAMPGYADGIRVDIEGNVWCGFSGGEGEDGVAVFAPDGALIGRILLPERCANVCFGGRKRNRLFMAASQSIYSLYVETQGVRAAHRRARMSRAKSALRRITISPRWRLSYAPAYLAARSNTAGVAPGLGVLISATAARSAPRRPRRSTKLNPIAIICLA